MKTTERTENTEWVFDPLTSEIICYAIEVHRNLGPGLLESTYQHCLAHELLTNEIDYQIQAPIPIYYKGTKLEIGFRADIIVKNKLILELKSVHEVSPVHQAQLLTYMKIAKIPVGLLINFNVKLLKNGIQRFAL